MSGRRNGGKSMAERVRKTHEKGERGAVVTRDPRASRGMRRRELCTGRRRLRGCVADGQGRQQESEAAGCGGD